MKPNNKKSNWILRTTIEMGFIIFLFYSNLLMGEFTKSNSSHEKSLVLAIKDVFTVTNFTIAIISSFIGHVIFEHFRKKLYY